MFNTYKKLMSNDAEQEKQESIITRSINFLLRPYMVLFRNSNKEPKKVGLEKITNPKVKTAQETVTKPSMLRRKRRAGKILWKKK